MRRAQRGDRLAFELLVERHQARMFTVAARLLGSPEDAADALQEALVRAWRALPRFRGDARFSTWLYRIVLNAVHDQRARTASPGGGELLDAVADARDRLAERELSDALQHALAVLDEDFRLAVLLYDVAGCSYEEVARIVGVPEGTVKSRIYRGRRELARLLGTAGVGTGSDRS